MLNAGDVLALLSGSHWGSCIQGREDQTIFKCRNLNNWMSLYWKRCINNLVHPSSLQHSKTIRSLSFFDNRYCISFFPNWKTVKRIIKGSICLCVWDKIFLYALGCWIKSINYPVSLLLWETSLSLCWFI